MPIYSCRFSAMPWPLLPRGRRLLELFVLTVSVFCLTLSSAAFILSVLLLQPRLKTLVQFQKTVERDMGPASVSAVPVAVFGPVMAHALLVCGVHCFSCAAVACFIVSSLTTGGFVSSGFARGLLASPTRRHINSSSMLRTVLQR
jgi:hypothetical protein